MALDTTDAAGYQADTISQEIAKVLKGQCSAGNLCPIKDILARFGDKWSIYVILLIGQYKNRRFSELKSGIPGISQRMLTVTLRTLEEDGLVLRTQYPQIPPKVEYQLTNLGKSLLEQIVSLTNWAETNFKEIISSRKKYAARKTVSGRTEIY